MINTPTDVCSNQLEENFIRKVCLKRLFPYLLLISILALTFLILALRGLDLGFVGDVLAYEYHYQRYGIQGGMHWLVAEHWHKHLLAPLFSASVHLMFPGQSAAWYATAFLAHFASGVLGFLLADTILHQKLQWLSFAVALMFVFTSFEVPANFEFPTIGVRSFALSLFLVSFWSYLSYIRTGRQNLAWYYVSLVSYLFGLMSYEITTFFFLLYPLAAYFEDRSAGLITPRKRIWLAKVAGEIVLYPIFIALYLYFLWVLFPQEGSFTLTSSWILRQIVNGIQLVFSPSAIWERIAPAFQPDIVLLTLLIWTGVFFAFWLWMQRTEATHVERQQANSLTRKLAILGAAMVSLNILSVAPTAWDNSRLLYPSILGSALFVLGGLFWLLDLLMRPMMQRAVFATVIAFFIATGAIRLLQVQGEYIHRSLMRLKVLTAIESTVPSWSGDVKPYILFISDAHPDDDLWLHGGDINFPYMFDLMYDTYDIAADVLYFDIPKLSAPSPNLPSEQYIGQFIIADEEGIYSPLRPSEPIPPERLVIIYYDSQTDTATIWDEIPSQMIEQANIVQRVPIDWRTNYRLLGQ